jgi:hypothetical protein
MNGDHERSSSVDIDRAVRVVLTTMFDRVVRVVMEAIKDMPAMHEAALGTSGTMDGCNVELPAKPVDYLADDYVLVQGDDWKYVPGDDWKGLVMASYKQWVWVRRWGDYDSAPVVLHRDQLTKLSD